MKNTVKTSQHFRYISGLLAFMLWGGWAYFVNNTHSNYTGVISGLAQGTASFVITLFMVHFVTYLYPKFKHPVSKLLLPAITTVSFTCFCLVLIHTLAGTPNILYTISPALTVAFLFCVYTSFKLHKINSTEG